jgi:hypothetical protein
VIRLSSGQGKNKNILIDGHNRYKICKKNQLSFKIIEINFDSIENVKFWIINNQLGRRNLNPDQMSYYRGMKYESIKKSKGGYEYVKSAGQIDGLTTEKLAREFNVSESTITRDARYARGIEFIGNLNQSLKRKILTSEVKVKRTSINMLSNPDIQKKIRVIHNEGELENKIGNIKSQILNEMEDQLRIKNNTRLENAQEFLADKEPAFLNIEDRLNRIKGMILSSLNKAIKNRNAKTLEEIRRLIDRLEQILD